MIYYHLTFRIQNIVLLSTSFIILPLFIYLHHVNIIFSYFFFLLINFQHLIPSILQPYSKWYVLLYHRCYMCLLYLYAVYAVYAKINNKKYYYLICFTQVWINENKVLSAIREKIDNMKILLNSWMWKSTHTHTQKYS
jgi:hypothetical protein